MFPSELSDILNAKGKAILNGRRSAEPEHTGVVFWGEVVDKRRTDKLIKILDEHMHAVLDAKPAEEERQQAIPNEYRPYDLEGVAPYSFRVRCGYVNPNDDPRVFELADKLGITKFMNSESLRKFASKVSGYKLERGDEGAYGQLSCYHQDDYVGLHSDWYGTAKSTHHFVDIQVHLPNRHAESHAFIYQRGQWLDGYAEVGAQPCLSVCKFPFWHMTGPLRSRPRHAGKARRWLVMTAYEIAD
jgi:hypothetical protein